MAIPPEPCENQYLQRPKNHTFPRLGELFTGDYLAHPLLGARFRECVAAVREQVGEGKSLEVIFGELDAMKFRSSVQFFRFREPPCDLCDGDVH